MAKAVNKSGKPVAHAPAAHAQRPAVSTGAARPTSAPPATRAFKVRATQMGYYDNARRRAGDVFVLRDPAVFSDTWMVRVDAQTPERITTGGEELKRKHDELLGAKITPGAGAVEGDNPLGAQ
jgi:hypothetical protein